jgi:hypothetical protein
MDILLVKRNRSVRGREMATDGVGIDPVGRERVIAQIDAFEEALDDADPSAYACDRLREAADELMRAVAAVILELGKQP